MKKENALAAGISEPEKVDAFMKDLKYPLKDVVEYLRTFILGVDKNVGEGIFWNTTTFYYTGKMEPFAAKEYKRFLVNFNFLQKDTIRLIFLRGASVDDPAGILEGDYKDGRRLALFKSMDDVKSKEKELKKILKQLIKQMS
jgi:hypothetical protein